MDIYIYIYIGWQRCKVYDEFNLSRCYNCCMYYHGKAKCKNVTRCGICADNHSTDKCNRKDECTIKCPLCSTANEKMNLSLPVNHMANEVTKCPSYRRLLMRTIAETDYPWTPSLDWLTPIKPNNNVQ